MSMYVKLEYALKVGHWLIDTALPDDNVTSRDNLRKAYYKAFDSKMLMQAVTDSQIEEERGQENNEQIHNNSYQGRG